MRVLLLGATGNLGLRCIAALVAHNHIVTLYVRNLAKLRSLVPSTLLEHVSIVVGDATDSAGIKRALLDHGIEGIIDVAGNQVWPWQEYLMPRIAKAVSDAAIAVGEERGRPLRAWICCGLGIMGIPGIPGLIQDYGPKIVGAQHNSTRGVIEPIPTSSLRWTLLGIAKMYPANLEQGVFELRPHNLLIQANTTPGWQDTWLASIPWIGWHLNLIWVAYFKYSTIYEEVADLLAEDLEKQSDEWIGKKVALKEKAMMKSD